MTTTTEQVRYSAASPAEAPYLRAERKLRTVACYGTIALLMFGPLAFGAVEAWSTLVLELGSAAVFALWVVSRLAASRPSLHLRIVHLPPMLFLALVGVQLIFGTTAYRYLTVTEFLKYVAYALVFFIATDLFRTDREMRRLCLALAAFGFAMAVFGCLQQFTSDEKLYWTRTPRFGGAVYGPYVNRNHYAGLMELLIPFALVGSFKLDLSASKRVVLGFATVLMTTTIFLCQSRGGMVAFALQCVFVAVVLLVRSRSTVPALTVTCALLLTVGLGLWLSSDQVIGRLTSIGQEADSVSRLQVSKDSLQMVKLHPVLGWGLGTFPTVYPQYRSFATDLFMNEAHNDVVQLLVETGVTGLSLALMLMLIVFREGIRQLNRAAFETWHTTGVVAALTACVGLSLHSLFDFNLHIPANAMLFYVLCALAASNGREETPVVRRLRRSGETAIVEV